MRNRIFPVIIILILLVPSAGLTVFGPAQPAANETLASAPSLTDPDGSLNPDFLDDVTDWWADRFALRQEMVTVQRKLTALVFGESGEEDVILGTDGWLFYAETLDDYQAVNTMSDREVWAAARSLLLMQEYCSSKDITFLFTVAPNKNSLYGEYMPPRYREGDASDRNLTRLTLLLKSEGIRYADLYAALSEEEEILYRKGDSHWNTRGASLAGDIVLDALGVEHESFFAGSWSTVYEETGDLYEMVYPTGTEKDEDQRYDREFTFTYVNAIRTTGDNRILTASESGSGSLVMYRDSFGNTLHSYLAEYYASALFSRVTPYDLTLLDSQDADTMIVELAERNLTWLNTLAPVMQAPEREWEGQEAALSGKTEGIISVTAEESLSLTGYVEVSGSLSEGDLDVDSPIYLLCGETLYEATPAGDGEAPFTAYIPAGAEEDMQVIVIRDGEYRVFSCDAQ